VPWLIAWPPAISVAIDAARVASSTAVGVGMSSGSGWSVRAGSAGAAVRAGGSGRGEVMVPCCIAGMLLALVAGP